MILELDANPKSVRTKFCVNIRIDDSLVKCRLESDKQSHDNPHGIGMSRVDAAVTCVFQHMLLY